MATVFLQAAEASVERSLIVSTQGLLGGVLLARGDLAQAAQAFETASRILSGSVHDDPATRRLAARP